MSDEVTTTQPTEAPSQSEEAVADLFSGGEDTLSNGVADEIRQFKAGLARADAEPEKMDDLIEGEPSEQVAEEPTAEATGEEEEPSDEPTGEAATDDETPSETPTSAFSEDVLKEIRRRVNGVIESDDDVYAHLDRLSERDSALSQIEQLYQSNPDLLRLAEMLESGTDFSVAALSLAGEVDPEPDVDDDPKEWAQWKLRQDKAAEQRKAGQKAAAEAEAKRKANSEQVLKHYEEFVRANSLSSEQAEQYARDYQVLLNGDPVTGKRRRDEHDVIWKGLNFDAEVEKRVAAELEKIKGGLKPDAAKKKLQGDGLPKGGGGKPNTPTRADRDTQLWREQQKNFNDVSDLHRPWP